MPQFLFITVCAAKHLTCPASHGPHLNYWDVDVVILCYSFISSHCQKLINPKEDVYANQDFEFYVMQCKIMDHSLLH